MNHHTTNSNGSNDGHNPPDTKISKISQLLEEKTKEITNEVKKQKSHTKNLSILSQASLLSQPGLRSSKMTLNNHHSSILALVENAPGKVEHLSSVSAFEKNVGFLGGA